MCRALVQVGTGILGIRSDASCRRRANQAGEQDSMGRDETRRGVGSAFDSRRLQSF